MLSARASLVLSLFIVVATARAQTPQSGGVAAHRATDPRPTVRAGRVMEYSIPSTVYGHARRVWVYTPAGYDTSKATSYPLVVAFDGADYLDTIPLPLMLDTLLAAGKIPPTVALLIDDSSGAERIAELGNSARFVEFLATDALPWLRAHWRVTRDPHQTVITGSSAGGLAAAYAGFVHPELFGKVFSQSGAFWRGREASNGAPYEWLTTQYAGASKKDLTLMLDVGAMETHAVLGGSGPVFIEANRRLRDALVAKGYALTYTEVPGGQHWPGTWKTRLPVGLVTLVR